MLALGWWTWNSVGYAFKPVLNTSRFEVIKSEFSNRESVLTEQVKSAEGEKYDINEQIKKLDNVNVRYAKEFPRLKSSVDALDDQIKVLNKHLAEVRQERLGLVQITSLEVYFSTRLFDHIYKELDKKTFQIIQDFTTVQQAVVPAENKVTNRALTARIERLEKLIEVHERNAFPMGGDG